MWVFSFAPHALEVSHFSPLSLIQSPVETSVRGLRGSTQAWGPPVWA